MSVIFCDSALQNYNNVSLQHASVSVKTQCVFLCVVAASVFARNALRCVKNTVFTEKVFVLKSRLIYSISSPKTHFLKLEMYYIV